MAVVSGQVRAALRAGSAIMMAIEFESMALMML
jgi:hypothetical protein